MHCARSCIRSPYLLSTAPITLSTRLPAICPCPGPCSYPPQAYCSCLATGDSRGRRFQISKSPTSRFCTIRYYLDMFTVSQRASVRWAVCGGVQWWRRRISKGEYGQNCPRGLICQSFIILCCVNIRISRGFSCGEVGNILYYSTIRAKHHFGQIPKISNDTSKKSLTSLKNVDRFTIVPIFHIWCLYPFCFVSCGLWYGHETSRSAAAFGKSQQNVCDVILTVTQIRHN